MGHRVLHWIQTRSLLKLPGLNWIENPLHHCMCYTEIHLMQCYVHLLHQGLVMGVMEIYILKHIQQRVKAIVSVFLRQHVASSFTWCPQDIVHVGALQLNTIALFTNSKVLDLIFNQS